MGRVAGASQRCSAQARADGRGLLAGDPVLYGKHAAARHGFREHGALAGSACAAARYAIDGLCGSAAGKGSPDSRPTETSAQRSDERPAAAKCSSAKEEDVYAPMGELVERTAESTD